MSWIEIDAPVSGTIQNNLAAYSLALSERCSLTVAVAAQP